jgi:hypothetical protein
MTWYVIMQTGKLYLILLRFTTMQNPFNTEIRKYLWGGKIERSAKYSTDGRNDLRDLVVDGIS